MDFNGFSFNIASLEQKAKVEKEKLDRLQDTIETKKRDEEEERRFLDLAREECYRISGSLQIETAGTMKANNSLRECEKESVEMRQSVHALRRRFFNMQGILADNRDLFTRRKELCKDRTAQLEAYFASKPFAIRLAAALAREEELRRQVEDGRTCESRDQDLIFEAENLEEYLALIQTEKDHLELEVNKLQKEVVNLKSSVEAHVDSKKKRLEDLNIILESVRQQSANIGSTHELEALISQKQKAVTALETELKSIQEQLQ